MSDTNELDKALAAAQEEFDKAKKDFNAGTGDERECTSLALGLLALQARMPGLSDADQLLIEGQREFLSDKLRHQSLLA